METGEHATSEEDDSQTWSSVCYLFHACLKFHRRVLLKLEGPRPALDHSKEDFEGSGLSLTTRQLSLTGS